MKLNRPAVFVMLFALVLSLAAGVWLPWTTPQLIRFPQVASALRIPLPV